MGSVILILLLQATSPLGVMSDSIRSSQDILDYGIEISIPDRGKEIIAATRVRYVVRGGDGPLLLDFDKVFDVDSVQLEDRSATEIADWTWTRAGDSDGLEVRHWGRPGDTLEVAVYYRGKPADGLIIRSNVHGDRTAFADNWPDRAHHWFPSEDHPSDKTTVQFAVSVPFGWRVVANGSLKDVDTLSSGRTAWRWREDRPIPVHTMVIGAGVMSVTDLGVAADAAQSVWTFPQDSAFAVEVPFRRALEMVEVLSRAIHPFPYAKLAHVQSSTRYGGMENSSAIFYNEGSYASRSMGEGVVAHEIAHQWFGDAVSQYEWHHLWLSEGFATYFGDLVFQLLGEEERFLGEMAGKRRSYFRSGAVKRPVIDTTEHNPFALLNANNYDKGAWVLHMLRAELGDSTFFAATREYFEVFRDSAVLTQDFARIVSQNAARSMDWFFAQWLLRPGYPKVEALWRHDADAGAVTLQVRQVQSHEWGDYAFTMPFVVRYRGGESDSVVVRVAGRDWVGTVPTRAEPSELILDPERTLLFEVLRIDRLP
jgi:aminopeptidase N